METKYPIQLIEYSADLISYQDFDAEYSILNFIKGKNITINTRHLKKASYLLSMNYKIIFIAYRDEVIHVDYDSELYKLYYKEKTVIFNDFNLAKKECIKEKPYLIEYWMDGKIMDKGSADVFFNID